MKTAEEWAIELGEAGAMPLWTGGDAFVMGIVSAIQADALEAAAAQCYRRGPVAEACAARIREMVPR
jgi:hypothetical protein